MDGSDYDWESKARVHPQLALWASRGFLCALALGGVALMYRVPEESADQASIGAPSNAVADATTLADARTLSDATVIAVSVAGGAAVAGASAAAFAPEPSGKKNEVPREVETRGIEAPAVRQEATADDAARTQRTNVRTVQRTRKLRARDLPPVRAAIRGVRKIGRAVVRLF